jgi:glycosyltransferase involved in cell wall biosynthesis
MGDNLRVGIVGPVQPPAGGMAGQTAQLIELLAHDGVRVTFVPTNAPYRPAFVGRLRGVRAVFRLLPYIVRLWRCVANVDVLHVMANSGWSWHLFAAPAIWVGRFRRRTVVVNYRGGEAEAFLSGAAGVVMPTLARADVVAVPSRFLQDIFVRHGVETHVLPNIIDRKRFHPADGPARASRAKLPVAQIESIYDIGTAIRAMAIVRWAVPYAMADAGAGAQHDQLCAAADAGLTECAVSRPPRS